ncbi:hypothetical protein CDAR_288821 [Caerostris darwini]|uniref:Uncharacterized protein n=1 Tax=Caerostris darwini TaxID=1538125 RepID=A0AAV4PMU5_9ARAC|nr:hypothetical protein CDAR_288821 [Caerostris darwini]
MQSSSLEGRKNTSPAVTTVSELNASAQKQEERKKEHNGVFNTFSFLSTSALPLSRRQSYPKESQMQSSSLEGRKNTSPVVTTVLK